MFHLYVDSIYIYTSEFSTGQQFSAPLNIRYEYLQHTRDKGICLNTTNHRYEAICFFGAPFQQAGPVVFLCGEA